MIRDLQKKFIIINMLLVFTVMVIVFSALCASNFNQQRSESVSALKLSLNRMDNQKAPPFYFGQQRAEGFSPSPVLVFRVTAGGAVFVTYSDNISITDYSLAQIASRILASDEIVGVLREYNLRYMKTSEHGGIKVAVIDRTNELAAIRNSIIISSLSMAASLAAFFAISLFLSRWIFKPAELAWRQQRRFVADASHELKTPLTVILANIGILKSMESDSAEASHWIENTEAEAQSMKKLVENLLFLAKTDDAKMTVHHSRLSLSDLAFGSSLAFEAVAFERKICIDTEGISRDIFINADEAQLRQLISILLDNAIKYSDSGGTVAVTVSSRQSKAILGVHNSGAPLSEEDISRLFERFYRADTSRTNEGYGLGLAIAKNIADLHHAKITASSGEDGTLFSVAFALAA
ncbi:MAG: HAMP domain-containing histidine kinase [Clostridiales bacterium]|nr:HAMP domain-containing histidine kinase [Clostridiales bacterium]